jgi:hypothetical protein
MKKHLFHFLLLTLLFGCASSKSKTPDTSTAPAPFEKIIFHTGRCFGTCPVYHLEVDGNKNVKLHKEAVFSRGMQTDSSKIGYFKGTADEEAFKSLVHEIQTIGIDTVNFGNARCCDGSMITIIVYRDGKRRFMESMFPPQRTRNLVAALYAICENSQLEKTEEKFVIESDEK